MTLQARNKVPSTRVMPNELTPEQIEAQRRLKKIARESQAEEEAKIENWLMLARKMFDNDEPTET